MVARLRRGQRARRRRCGPCVSNVGCEVQRHQGEVQARATVQAGTAGSIDGQCVLLAQPVERVSQAGTTVDGGGGADFLDEEPAPASGRQRTRPA